MLRDITLGQYYQGESWVHKLDPRTKISAVLVYIVALFVVKTFVGFAIGFCALVAVIIISKVPLSFIVRGLKPVFLIILLTFILNLFMFDGKILWHWGILKISDVGLYKAAFLSLRLVFLIIGTSMLTLTTRPIALTDGLEFLLKPFSKIGLPSSEIAMMMTIALRFIPTLMEETDKIMKAQQARGADFETGSLLTRAKNMVPILVPLFIGAFRIAQDMAMAMEARCYRGGEGRTRMHQLKYEKRDIAAMLMMAVFLGACIVERIVL